MSISHARRLKKISDTVYIDAEQKADERRPLEYRRAFNRIEFPLTDLQPHHYYLVNDVDFGHRIGRKDLDHRVLDEVKPNPVTTHGISAKVDMERFHDRLDIMVEEKGTEFVSLERVSEIRVHIRSKPRLADWAKYPNGVIHGLFMRNTWGQVDECVLELDVEQEQFDTLYRDVVPGTTLEVTCALLGFEYEVDSALSEPWHPKTIIVPDFTEAPVHNFIIKAAPPAEQTDENDDVREEAPTYLNPPEPVTQVVPMIDPKVVPLLSGIRTAMFVVAAVLVIQLLRGL